LNASKLIKAANWIQTSGNAGHLEGITDTATPPPEHGGSGRCPTGWALMARHHQQNADQTMLQTVLAGLQLEAQRATGAPLLFSAVLPTCWN
jgi:hypothetical protein